MNVKRETGMERQENEDQDIEEQEKSKSQIKREMHELQALGKQLVGLPH